MWRTYGIALAVLMMAGPAVAEEISQQQREERLAQQLSGTVFEGMFTVVGKESPPKPERYEIKKVEKAPNTDNLWVLTARIKYGERDVTVPMTVPIEWADDTPVISMTDWNIPPLGVFSARVLIHKDRYAGTWQHGEVGGHLFGTISKGEDAAESSDADESGDSK